jgi:glycosyltransferase involved in cell wall biosynthesis
MVTQSYYPFFDRGGPAVKVRALARGLALRGHQVTVLTSDFGVGERANDMELTPSPWGWRSPNDGVDAFYLKPRGIYRSLTWNPAVHSFCRKQMACFDVAHIYGLYDLLAPPVARACRASGIPYVVEPIGMFRPIVRSIALKWVYRRLFGDALIRGAQRIVATSVQEQQELIEGGIPAEKIVIRRNGIEPPEHLPAPGSFRRRLGIPEDAQLVLYLGRLVSKKSPDLLLEAFAHWQARVGPVPSSFLVLAGPDEADGYRRQLEARAARLHLSNQVLFTGPLYGDAKWSAYRDADVFVLPSQNENFGNTAAEAVACGTPVLLTDRCGVAALVEGRAGLVVPHQRDALSRALEQLLGDAQLRDRLKAGCAAAVRDLGWEEPLDQMETLYASLINWRTSLRSPAPVCS